MSSDIGLLHHLDQFAHLTPSRLCKYTPSEDHTHRVKVCTTQYINPRPQAQELYSYHILSPSDCPRTAVSD